MTARTALILGLALVAASILHGGIWTAGHDFILNRFTGEWVFVPPDMGDETDDFAGDARALTPRDPDDRVARSQRRR